MEYFHIWEYIHIFGIITRKHMLRDSLHKKLFEAAISGVQSVTDPWVPPKSGATRKSIMNWPKRGLRRNSPGKFTKEIHTQLSLFNEQ